MRKAPEVETIDQACSHLRPVDRIWWYIADWPHPHKFDDEPTGVLWGTEAVQYLLGTGEIK